MTDLSYRTPTKAAGRVAAPPLLYAVVGLAALLGVLIGQAAGGAIDTVEGPLRLLIRFMAAMKLAGVVGAAALIHWRLRQPIPRRMATAYVVSLAPMAVAPGLIWSLAHVGLAALLFHAGLLMFLYLAWKDDGVLARRRIG